MDVFIGTSLLILSFTCDLVDSIDLVVVAEMGKFEFPVGFFVVVVLTGTLVIGLLGRFLVDAFGLTVVDGTGRFELTSGFFVVVVVLAGTLFGRFSVDTFGLTVVDATGRFELTFGFFVVVVIIGGTLFGRFLVETFGLTVVVEAGRFELTLGFFVVVVVLAGTLVVTFFGRFVVDTFGLMVVDGTGFFELSIESGFFDVTVVGVFVVDQADGGGFDVGTFMTGTFSSVALEMIGFLVNFCVACSVKNGTPFAKITNESKNTIDTRECDIFENIKLNFFANEPNQLWCRMKGVRHFIVTMLLETLKFIG